MKSMNIHALATRAAQVAVIGQVAHALQTGVASAEQARRLPAVLGIDWLSMMVALYLGPTNLGVYFLGVLIGFLARRRREAHQHEADTTCCGCAA